MRTLYRAARIHTQAYPETGDWLLADSRHVQRVGVGDPPQADRVVDLPGTTILPGFIDGHVHLTETGLSLADDDIRAARSAEDMLRLVRGRASEGEGPLFLLGYDESAWERPDLPTIADLDAACARPLVIRRVDGHVALANRAALESAGVLDRPGMARDETGAPTGIVTQRANDAIGLWAMSSLDDLARQDLQLQAASLAASNGITAVHEMSMPHWNGEADLRVLLDHRARLPVDAMPIPATTDLGTAIGNGLAAIGGDLPVDGSIGARTAWVGDPYLDGGDGVAYFADDELAEFFHGAHAAGLQVGVHAIGDRAIDQVLRVWERVYHALDSRERRHFRARRHRIEHFEVAATAQVERAAMLGLAASVQPAFDANWGGSGGLYELRLGPERAARMNPFRTMLERGVEVGVGSDAPITALDPMRAVEALERHHDPAQRLSRREAIRLHTIGSARVGHQEDKKGSLAPGMHADFAVFDADPYEEPSLQGLRPVLTVSLGREVFAA
ncbi:MAG: amidohydrolase [Actinomycetota bacterium]